MLIDTYALGEAKAARAEFACGCMMCQGKTANNTDRALDLPSTVTRTVPSTIQVDSDGTLPGTIDPGEGSDILGLTVVAGQTYSVALRGAGPDALEDPFLAVYNQLGALVNFDDDGGAGVSSLLTFTATASGTYFIEAGGYFLSDTGDYTVDVWRQTVDQVPDTFAGAVTIELGTSFGHLETSNDVDTYKVFLEAGKFYTFELAGGADYATSFLNVPRGELDTILGIYSPDGVLLGANDDISFPSDLSSGFSFVPQEDGFYYLDALAYPGQTGGYTLDIDEVDLSQFDPLDSIDWVNADNIPTTTVGGVPTAYVFFGDSDENFGQTGDDGVSPMVTIDWNAFERGQVMLALEEYTRILGINYEITTDIDQATFRLLKTESQQYGAYFFPQDPAFGADQGVGVFNVASGGWDIDQQQSLLKGGYSFSVILHEFGHAHGLAHPHDRGGGSEIMLGVTSPFGSLGLFDLNQGVYTVMSYNDAWVRHPDGPTPYTLGNIDSGWPGTLSALDIGVLQERYGVTRRATGNDVYVLGDSNDPGTFYTTIWDSAGTDEIRYNGGRDTQIDLTAATLDYSPTGGGVVSFVDNIWGGYTIANDVVIERATGGSGNDALLGNAAANILTGNAGDDYLMGRGGADTLTGGAGFDTASWADAAAAMVISVGNNGTGTASDGDRYTGIEKVEGSRFNDTISGGNSADTLFGLGGNDKITGGVAADTIDGGAGDDVLEGGLDNDILLGGTGNDRLDGGSGADTLTGGAGDDQLRGGIGNDRFVFTLGGGTDTILDFKRGDLIDLSALAGVDRSDVTIANGRLLVENGAADFTIFVNGDRVTDAALIFGAAMASAAMASAAPDIADAPLVGRFMIDHDRINGGPLMADLMMM